MVEEIQHQERWLGVIARALSYLCVHATDLRQADLTPKALLLDSFGLSRRDVAVLLDTTEDTIRVTVNAAKKEREEQGKKKGRRKGRGPKKK